MPIQTVQIIEEPIAKLIEHGQISIAFKVHSRFSVHVIDTGLGGIRLTEERVAEPFTKDYDTGEEGSPERWLRRWKLDDWGLLAAYIDDKRVGGAVTAWRTDYVDMLERRDDLAVLWDLRVDPHFRGQGIGYQLFTRAEQWALERGCRLFKVESGSDNVPACRFYARQGCVLGGMNRFAYGDASHEWQLFWYKTLCSAQRET